MFKFSSNRTVPTRLNGDNIDYKIKTDWELSIRYVRSCRSKSDVAVMNRIPGHLQCGFQDNFYYSLTTIWKEEGRFNVACGLLIATVMPYGNYGNWISLRLIMNMVFCLILNDVFNSLPFPFLMCSTKSVSFHLMSVTLVNCEFKTTLVWLLFCYFNKVAQHKLLGIQMVVRSL